MKGIGIQLDEATNDLKIAVKRNLKGKIIRGMVIGDITAQNQFILLQSQPGEIKHAPVTGVGITSMLLDNNRLHWQTQIRRAFEREGFRIRTLRFLGNNEIEIDANY